MRDRLFVLLQRLLPQHLLGRLAGALADSTWPPLKNLLIRLVLARFDIQMGEADPPEPLAYSSLNEFFARPLRDGARPLDDAAVVSPVDGTLVCAGTMEGHSPMQAKGHSYSLEALLAGDGLWVPHYRNGQQATIYLAPHNYHRVHAPCAGRLLRSAFVPGSCYSVNAATVRALPGLFAKNERLIMEFEGADGRFIMIMIGAMLVSGIATVWGGRQEQRGGLRMEQHSGPHLQRGDEAGRFLFGSSVILLLPPGAPALRPLDDGQSLRMGQALSAPLR